jgi:AcrR family transcriptional regulator
MLADQPAFYRTVGLILSAAMVRPRGGVGAGHRVVRRRQTRTADREQAIRAAALRIFREKGYDAASMQDIADAVGLYKGSLYYYVSSKEELLVQLFEGRAEQVLAEIDAAASGSGVPRERLRTMVRVYMQGVLRNLDSVHVYVREEQALPPPALRDVHRQQRAMRDHFERVIGEGMRAGDFAESDPKLAALALLGMCTWVHRWYRPGGRIGEAAIADDFAERAIRMLSA